MKRLTIIQVGISVQKFSMEGQEQVEERSETQDQYQAEKGMVLGCGIES